MGPDSRDPAQAARTDATSPRTSVIIPCWQAELTLGLQLEALAHQAGAQPFEVVIADNGSSDGTREVAAHWGQTLDLRVVDASAVTGAAYARNRGASAARGELLLFCDADDVVAPHFVAHCQRALEDVSVCVTGFVPVDEEHFTRGLTAVLAQVHDSELYTPPTTERQDPRWPVLPGGCFGIRRDFFEQVGGFDPSSEPGAEDNDLGVRCTQAGHLPPILDCTTLAYRTPVPGARPYGLFRRRARSTALLLTRADLWQGAPVAGGRHPLTNLMRTVLSGLKVVGAPRERPGWRTRLAQSLGLAEGYVLYRVLRRVPQRRLREGMHSD